MPKTCVAALLVLVTLLAAYHEVDADCCGKPCEEKDCHILGHLCNDCTESTPYCGYGPCNIMGCNCDGGCRGGDCRNCDCDNRAFKDFSNMPSTPKKCLTAAEKLEQVRRNKVHLDRIFEQADKNGDGLLDLKEAQAWIQQFHPSALARRPANIEEEFKKMDTNNDGFISRKEIDP